MFSLKAPDRRQFLKNTALLLGCAVLVPVVAVADQIPSYAAKGNKLYRGTRDGLLSISIDDGFTWQEIANFGPENAIANISFHDLGLINVEIQHQGYNFTLQSPNDKSWYSIHTA